MAKEIFMPKLSSTMETGTLLQWLKAEGEPVEVGDPLFEIMTDKINIEVEAYERGILLKQYFQADAQIPVNQVIGYIGEAGEHVPEQAPGLQTEPAATPKKAGTEETALANTEQQSADERVRATPAARRVARERQVQLTAVNGSGPNGRIQLRDLDNYTQTGQQAEVRMTPLARKMAADAGVEPSALSGSGVNGKIVKADVIAANSVGNSFSAAKPLRKKISGMRKVIAERMAHSAFTAPHVTLTTEIDMSQTAELRTRLLPVIERQTGLRLSYTELIIKATAEALIRYPAVNAAMERDELIYHEAVHIGVAVAVPDGLVVPVLKHADQKRLSELTKETKEISKRAREQKLLPDQLKGSTFTISNLGMYAIDAFTPIINAPETAILGIGRIAEKPVAVDGAVVIRPMMTASLSFDHRAIDGAPAAEFLTEVKRILENPWELLV